MRCPQQVGGRLDYRFPDSGFFVWTSHTLTVLSRLAETSRFLSDLPRIHCCNTPNERVWANGHNEKGKCVVSVWLGRGRRRSWRLGFNQCFSLTQEHLSLIVIGPTVLFCDLA